jgi:hypothetical protein
VSPPPIVDVLSLIFREAPGDGAPSGNSQGWQ